jgi:hypothetical protein
LERKSKTEKREFLAPRVTNITPERHKQKGLNLLFFNFLTSEEVNHIRYFAIEIAKYLILLSCRLAMEHLCVLQLETALATLVTTWFTLAERKLQALSVIIGKNLKKVKRWPSCSLNHPL